MRKRKDKKPYSQSEKNRFRGDPLFNDLNTAKNAMLKKIHPGDIPMLHNTPKDRPKRVKNHPKQTSIFDHLKSKEGK